MNTKRHSHLVWPGVRSRYRQLPLFGPIVDQVVSWLRQEGYAETTIRGYFKFLGRLVRRLQRRRGPDLRRLSRSDLEAAYEHFRGREPGLAGSIRTFGRFLQDQGRIGDRPRGHATPLERQIEGFSSHLRETRGLAATTVAGHQSRIRIFLEYLKVDRSPKAIRSLSLDQVEAFLRYSSRTNNRFSLQHVVASVRAYLRYQHARGVLRQPLHQRIDTPRTYRLEQLPRALPWDQVVAFLRSINQSTSAGRRDFTLLYLAARYGLRCGELVRLTLDDLDWSEGTLRVVQTKTRRSLLLPLTDEAGEVLSKYLKSARPQTTRRELFLRRRAPVGALAHTAVHDIIDLHHQRSGLDLPRFSSHALRHSLAVHLLRRGVPMPGIGDVLGHRDPESTSVYLRLAVDDLREVGLSVPMQGRPAALERRDWKSRLPKVRGPRIAKRLPTGDFRSGFASSLRQYLANRRALGRRYTREETVLRRWDAFVQRHRGHSRNVAPGIFHRWAQSLSHLHPTVRRNQLRIVRNFLLFDARDHTGTHVPDMATFPKSRPPRPPRLVGEAEMARVLATAKLLPESHQNRLRAPTIRLALLLLFCCGLRRGELLRLQLRHFVANERLLKIEATKFHKSRLVPLSHSVHAEIQGYLKQRKSLGVSDDPDSPLIWSDCGVGGEHCYCPPALAHNWQFLCLATGVLDERGRPPRLHDLRHSFAVTTLRRWYASGDNVQAKLPLLATYLGHVSAASTHLYLHLTPELGEAANQRFHRHVSRILTQGGSL